MSNDLTSEEQKILKRIERTKPSDFWVSELCIMAPCLFIIGIGIRDFSPKAVFAGVVTYCKRPLKHLLVEMRVAWQNLPHERNTSGWDGATPSASLERGTTAGAD